MPRLALYLLGPPRIERDGTPVQMRRRKAVALLTYLVRTGSTHSREKLATLLWPESDQSRALANLRVALVALNDALGEGWLVIDRENVRLSPDPSTDLGQELWLDVHQFRDRLAACRTHDHPPERVCPECLSALAEAVDLYRDDFLAGFTIPDSPAFDEWQFFQTESLRGELAGALERLVHGHGTRGEYGAALPYARRWVALDSLHEPAHRLLMQLYAWSGQRAAALRQYTECERILREELDAPPEEETTQLYQTIQAHRELPPPVDAPAEAPASPVAGSAWSPEATRHNLPASPTPFIGREAQLAEVREMLTRPEVRLLTLVGAGGMGKTRLAIEIAAGLLDAFPDGVFFVPLAPVDDPALVVPAVATTLGVRESAGNPLLESLQYSLRDRQLLLVVDNFEHLLPAARALNELLSAAPRLKVLVTSRASLHVYGEHEYPVPPMIIPDPETLALSRIEGSFLDRLAQVEAVQLFAQRARAVRADFALSEENAPAVAEVCTRLDGLPLAIELAAAWGKMLTPAEIAGEIERGLDFLEAEWRDVPARQRSMRAVFDHSWRLLTPREQDVLQVLSVFRGGFTRRAAGRVAGASLRELMSLLNKSLLQRTAAPSDALRQAQDRPLRQAQDRPLRQDFGELSRAAQGTAGRYRLRTAALFGLAALTRPEGYLLFALSLVDYVWGSRRRSGRQPHRPERAGAGLDNRDHATRNTQHATRFTFHVSRFTHHVSRLPPMADVVKYTFVRSFHSSYRSNREKGSGTEEARIHRGRYPGPGISGEHPAPAGDVRRRTRGVGAAPPGD